MDHDIGLQQAILASLRTAGGGSSSFQRSSAAAPRLAPAPTRTTTTTHQTAMYRAAAAGGPSGGAASRITRDIAPQRIDIPYSSNVASNANRRNTLQRQGIVPAVPSNNTNVTAAAVSPRPTTQSTRTRSNPASSNGNNRPQKPKSNTTTSGPQGGTRELAVDFEASANASFGGGGGGAAGASNTATTTAPSEIAGAYAHLGAPFRSAAVGNGSRPAAAASSQQQQQSLPAVSDAATAPLTGWTELRSCLQAGGRVIRQNPSGSHLVIESASADSSSSSSANHQQHRIGCGDVFVMVGADTLGNMSRGAVAATASSAVMQFQVKPMSRNCSVFVGVVAESSENRNSAAAATTSSATASASFDANNSSFPVVACELLFESSATSTGNRATVSVCDFMWDSDAAILTRKKHLEAPQQPLKGAEANTTARYARAKNSATDWNPIPVALTINKNSISLDVCGECAIKNVSLNNSNSNNGNTGAANFRVVLAVSGRCAVKNLTIGDCAEIRKQQLQQTVSGARDPMVSLIESEIMTKAPNVQWEDIAGLEDAKRILNEAVILPMIIPEFFAGSGRASHNGILLFGSGGTGKTELARALATAAKCTFFTISAATLMSKYVGESEKMVKALFAVARRDAPSIIFFDEIDSVMTKRGGPHEHESARRMKTEMLQQMDGVYENKSDGGDQPRVIVLCTTNKPWDIDEAMIRRLEKRIYIPLPNDRGRLELFVNRLRKMRTSIPLPESLKKMPVSAVSAVGAAADDDDAEQARTQQSQQAQQPAASSSSTSLDAIATAVLSHPHYDKLRQLVEMTRGFSGADISIVLRDAAMFPLRRLIAGKSPAEIYEMKQRGELLAPDGQPPPVAFEDVVEAIKKTNPSNSQDDVKKYADWDRQFGST